MLSARRCWSKARVGIRQGANYHASHALSQSSGLNAIINGANAPHSASTRETGDGTSKAAFIWFCEAKISSQGP